VFAIFSDGARGNLVRQLDRFTDHMQQENELGLLYSYFLFINNIPT
jgi:hypothetical protein